MQPFRAVHVTLVLSWMIAGCGASLPPTDSSMSVHARLARVVQRLTGDTARSRDIYVYPDPRPYAYSWSGGAIALSDGLLGLVDDNQLAAIIAHEIGHLAGAGASSPQTFSFDGQQVADQEQRADDFAVRALRAAGIPSVALSQALTVVRDSPHTSAQLIPALTRRIERLSSFP